MDIPHSKPTSSHLKHVPSQLKPTPSRLKCITYNILAQRYLKKDEYDRDDCHLDENILTWDYRLGLIIKKLMNTDADIICLQEVELNDIEKDFSPLFLEYNYASHVISKKRSSPIGNMILWKKKLSMSSQSNNSCSLYIELKNSLDKSFWVMNLHLRSGIRSKRKERVSQIKSCLKLIDKNLPGFIVGDFNDDFLHPICLEDTNESLLSILRENSFIIHTPGYSCSVISRDKTITFWRFDHVASSASDVRDVRGAGDASDVNIVQVEFEDYQEVTSLIPSATEGSDHCSVCFHVVL